MQASHIPYPLKLLPYYRKAIWGGRRLTSKYHKKAPFADIAESWELSSREGESSIICNGIYRETTLRDFIERYHGAGKYSADDFPILIKLIDAKERLSVQLHPSDAIARRSGYPYGKNEMWYVIEAEPDAEIIYGASDMTALRCMLCEGEIDSECMKCFRRVPVKKGDVFYVPSGLVHAVGGGLLLAEIQQSCDLTYRLFDYGRGRSLHIAEASEAIRSFTEKDINELRYKNKKTSKIPGCIAASDYFSVILHRLDMKENASFALTPPRERDFTVLLCTCGEAELRCKNEIYPISAGETYMLPYGNDTVELFCGANKTDILEVWV